MKKLLISGSLAALLLPALAFAAYNDVSLTTDAIISVGGVSLTVTGSTAVVESMTVSDSSVSFTMQAGSFVDVQSTDRASLVTNSQGQNISTDSCSSSVSELKLISNDAETLTITPGSTCVGSFASTDPATYNSSSGSSSGGGGGNGSPVAYSSGGSSSTGVNASVASTPAPGSTATLQAQIAALQAKIKGIVGAAGFTKNLQVGSVGASAKALQVYLNAHGFTVAAKGAGSAGMETTKFGPATKAALIKMQKAVGIKPASGYFGPLTRAYINAHP